MAKAQAELTNPEKSLVATIRPPGPGEPERSFRYIVRKALGQLEGDKPPLSSPVSSLCVGFDICRGICHKLTMSERYVKLFKNGRNQAVRIPREFELPGENAIIRKEGQRLIIEAVPPKSLLAVLATLPTLDEDFPPIEDLPAEPVDL